MNVEILFQIAAVGIVVAVLNQILIKSDRSEQAMLVTVAGIIVVLFMLITRIGDLFETMRSVFGL
ncbi:MAG: stage III sporulation protein AC [Clostridiales bacterium]|nr:MAG: stage III sporulation protein AC [Clostridiales bacterium]